MNKTAILFGINDYPQIKLRNAANDAIALSAKLQELGFETRCFTNVDAKAMDQELVKFKTCLEKSNVALFFFAGHGVQCKGENYLATTDTSFADESSCRYSSIPFNQVIDIFEEGSANTKIFILDACRDNPFVAWRSTAHDGLAPVYAPKGTIIAYSTSPGQKASDGNGENGIYTNALLMHIATKRVPIEDMFKRVRNTVSSHTNHQQITWEHTSLMGTFYFNSGFDEGVLKTLYSESALADNGYTFDDKSEIESIVEELKSYNWYTQNPAMRRVDNINFANSDIDDLFILGRNIYQAACGSSGNAINWIESIETHLNAMPNNSAIHMLNGILFEIYFDSNGKMRKRFKSEYYEKPVKMCLKSKYGKCGSFIRGYLEQYPQRIIYAPGSDEVFSFDVTIRLVVDFYHLDCIFLDGLSCLYDDESQELYRYSESNYAVQEITIAHLENLIAECVVAPKNKVKISYNINLRSDDKLSVPYNLNLLRYT